MRLSRPGAIGLLLLCAAVVLWLVARTLAPAGDPAPSGAGPSVSAEERTPAPSPSFGGPLDRPADEEEGSPEPSATADPQEDEADAGPTGTDTRDWDDIDACRDDVLPAELDEVADDVEAGGPFEYADKDGSTFGNFEGYLPEESRGYYREYTVETPGLEHRGARRIVTGGDGADPEVWYYTEDHYESFCEFAP